MAAASPAAAPAEKQGEATPLAAAPAVAPLPPLSTVLNAAVTRFADTTRPLPSATEATNVLATAASHLAAAAGTGSPVEGVEPRDDAELLSAVVKAAAAGMAARLTGRAV